jgi:cytochrome P450 family 142 subfamily A polypeptide 1
MSGASSIRLLDGATYTSDPSPTYAWLRANAPVYWDEASGVFGIAKYEDVMEVSRHPEIFCSREGSRPKSPALPSMINQDDPRHTRQRSLVNKGFTPRRVAEHEPYIRKVANDLIDAVAARGECDFVKHIAAALPMILIGDLLGIRPGDRNQLQRWSDHMIDATAEDVTPEIVINAMRAMEEYTAYNRDVVAARRRTPTNDLIGVLVHAEIDGEALSDDELLHESLLLLVGGNETTRNVISGGMLALIENPAERRKLVADPTKIPGAIEEMLRWVSPILNMARTATRDTELRGQKIRAGEQVLLMYPSANRDEDVFPAPERFEVERTPNHHVAFGFGPHFCLGASLARLELRVVFEELLARLPDVELAPGAEVTYTASSFIRGIRSMPVVFTPRAR